MLRRIINRAPRARPPFAGRMARTLACPPRPFVKRMLILTLAALAVLYLGCCLFLYLKQRSFQYFPTSRRLGPTQMAGTFRNGTTLLQLTVRPHAGPGAVLYFGGNGEDVSSSVGALLAAFPEREIVMLHYRGYGGSAGTPNEEDIAADAAGLFDKVHALHPDVIVVGRSLGTGVAARLASTRPVSRLVLVTPYDSLLAIAQRTFSLFPVRWLLIDKYETWRYVPRITAPVLILQAELDETIPAASTEALRVRFPAAQVRYVVVPGASHNTILDDPAYVRSLAEFGAAP
jgi:hypothetical protein